MCSDCADLIDKNEGKGFSVQQIRSWKRRSEENQAIEGRLRIRRRRPCWLDSLTSPHYVNVPRLLYLIGNDALSNSSRGTLKNGFPRDGMIVRELIEVENALRRMTVEAVDIQEIDDPATQLSEGLFLSYRGGCRTKNGSSENPKDVETFSFDRSPLIYMDCNGYRYIQPYDPVLASSLALLLSSRSTIPKNGSLQARLLSASQIFFPATEFAVLCSGRSGPHHSIHRTADPSASGF